MFRVIDVCAAVVAQHLPPYHTGAPILRLANRYCCQYHCYFLAQIVVGVATVVAGRSAVTVSVGHILVSFDWRFQTWRMET
jgi:hypothetical protein